MRTVPGLTAGPEGDICCVPSHTYGLSPPAAIPPALKLTCQGHQGTKILQPALAIDPLSSSLKLIQKPPPAGFYPRLVCTPSDRKQTADAVEEGHLALSPPFGLCSLKPTQSIRRSYMNFKDSILLKRSSKQKYEAIDVQMSESI
ncbi:hypothetical protein MJT46_012113 [Ovis ammon polii x Ovis aries]|nr:hypothetical protein MJT46_012113 [Ovis ammon polii x Ovis aries]